MSLTGYADSSDEESIEQLSNAPKEAVITVKGPPRKKVENDALIKKIIDGETLTPDEIVFSKRSNIKQRVSAIKRKEEHDSKKSERDVKRALEAEKKKVLDEKIKILEPIIDLISVTPLKEIQPPNLPIEPRQVSLFRRR